MKSWKAFVRVFPFLLCLAAAAKTQSGEPPAIRVGTPTLGSEGIAASERLDAVRRQIQWNDIMRHRAGFPPANGAFFAFPAPYADLSSGWSSSGHFPRIDRGAPVSRQPIGRVELQTGPNRWISFPVFAEPMHLSSPFPPATPVAPTPKPENPGPTVGPQEF